MILLIYRKNTQLDGTISFMFIQQSSAVSDYIRKKSFNNEKYKNSTTLSTYVWSLKANNILPSFKWSVVKKAKSYSNTTKSCPLCLQEKLEILCYENKPELLNKRTEIISKCRHINKYILANYKTKD